MRSASTSDGGGVRTGRTDAETVAISLANRFHDRRRIHRVGFGLAGHGHVAG